MAPELYLDHAATSPLRRECRALMAEVAETTWANPSSPHAAGRRARAVVERARRQIAAVLGALPAEIVFTSGGTEANNLAIAGTAHARPERRHLVASAIEHHSVLEACRALEREGYALSLVAPDGDGIVPAERVLSALRPDTALCCLMLANNEVGAVQPVAEVARGCRAAGIPFLVDAVAAAGRLAVRVPDIGADLLTLSAHKFGGPKGVGVLYVGAGRELAPLVHGGGQERRWRPGTENVPAIAAAGLALELAAAELGATRALLQVRGTELAAAVRAQCPGAIATGPEDPILRLPGLVSFAFPDLDGDALLAALDLLGVAAGSGAACTSGSRQPSHVLAAMGHGPAACRAALRLSLGRETSSVDAAEAARLIATAVERQTAVARGA